jgi:NitT/TauT family transport system substrate-binding protein
MRNSARSFVFWLLLTSLASSFATAAGADIVVGALKGPSGIGMVRLFETPPSSPEGSKIIPVAVASADLMTPKLVSGEYSAAILPINMAAKLYSAGVPIKLAAIVGEGMVSFLTTDPAIAGLTDLKGAAVNVAGQGATPDYLFRKLLKDAGLDPDKDLRLDYALPYAEAAVALAGGKIRCAVLPEPFATLALAANPTLRRPFDLQALWTASTGQASYPMTAFVVSAKLAAERPAAVKAILDAYRASIASVTADPKAAGALVERYDLGLKASVAEKAIPRSAYVFRTATEARPSIEALLSTFLASAPVSIGGKLPDAGFYASIK